MRKYLNFNNRSLQYTYLQTIKFLSNALNLCVSLLYISFTLKNSSPGKYSTNYSILFYYSANLQIYASEKTHQVTASHILLLTLHLKEFYYMKVWLITLTLRCTIFITNKNKKHCTLWQSWWFAHCGSGVHFWLAGQRWTRVNIDWNISTSALLLKFQYFHRPIYNPRWTSMMEFLLQK